MSETAIEVPKELSNDTFTVRWWLCLFCYTPFGVAAKDRRSVPGCCPACKRPFTDWRELS